MNAITRTDTPPLAGGSALMPANMDQAMRLAEMMARSSLVPQCLQQKPADCFLVIEQALRWNMSPFAVAQCTSVVKGRLNFEGKLVAAAVQSCGILSGRLDYEYEGSGDQRTITVTGRIRGDDRIKPVTVVLKDVKTDNEQWRKQPDQMLAYSGTRTWARRWTPEVMLGVYSPEEFDSAPAAEPMPPSRGPVVDSTATEAPALESPWVAFNPSGKLVTAKNVQTWTKWCAAFIAALESAEAVAAWRDAMQPHLEALEAVEPRAVEHVQGLAQDRLDALAEAADADESAAA
jgi:hypothetical protein